jgi:hypothetical protein
VNASASDRAARAQRSVEANRTALAILLGILWTGGIFLWLRDIPVSLLCGAAFAGVLAAALPRPPRKM